MLFVDGFAGPGHYLNHEEGSPLAALRVAEEALREMGVNFIADRIHGAFIESDPQRFEMLCKAVAAFEGKPRLGVTKKCCEFAEGIRQKSGGSGTVQRRRATVPIRGSIWRHRHSVSHFRTFAECMQGKTAELLINLDADGIGRIFTAESNNNRDAQLTELFGNESWQEALTAGRDLRRLSIQILDLYKVRLRALPGIKFVWSFAMRGKRDALNYYLVFATKHPLGMEKMKEAMRAIDKSGAYTFSDAHVEQRELFREDDAERYAADLLREFDGLSVPFADVQLFALNETPLLGAKTMLAILEKQGRLQVETQVNEPRRAGTFPEDKVKALRFGRF